MYSIAYGLIAGIITYMVLNTTVWIIEKLSGGRIKPVNKEKDPWTYKFPGGLLPPWVVRAVLGKKDFWREDEESIGVDADRASESSLMDRMTAGKAGVQVQPGEKATIWVCRVYVVGCGLCLVAFVEDIKLSEGCWMSITILGVRWDLWDNHFLHTREENT